MQVEAIYDHGKLEFTQPIQLKHERVKVIVDVPDIEIKKKQETYNLPPEVVKMAKKIEQDRDAVLDAPFPPDGELPKLTAKKPGRIEAFALRDDVRSMR
jgi:hypothetical protein